MSLIHTASNRENPHQEHVKRFTEGGGWPADVGALRSAGAKARVESHADGGARRFFSKASQLAQGARIDVYSHLQKIRRVFGKLLSAVNGTAGVFLQVDIAFSLQLI